MSGRLADAAVAAVVPGSRGTVSRRGPLLRVGRGRGGERPSRSGEREDTRVGGAREAWDLRRRRL
eukprot:4813564-Heterocapsa_arctica.AAC.1